MTLPVVNIYSPPDTGEIRRYRIVRVAVDGEIVARFSGPNAVLYAELFGAAVEAAAGQQSEARRES